jgi:sterol desaturase/sphingolipid hydroxylase (fatty acid hydroxylase superfamily)
MDFGISDLPILFVALILIGLKTMFWSVQGQLSIAKLSLTLGSGILAFAVLHQRKSRQIKPKVIIRALFPQRFFGASTRADAMMLALNLYVVTMVIGWALLSQHTVAAVTNATLQAWFGAFAPTAWSSWVTGALMTLALFLAYEFAYWFDHFLSHRVPFLWQFHKVHHAAEVLTPLTNFRVHPVDTLVFYNIVALTMGLTDGLVSYLFGSPTKPFTLYNANVLLVVGAFLVQQLQHTDFWIPFTGIWGKIFLSPAHHQIHHSLNPAHYDKNMGGNLSVFDWLFGTLHIPSKQRERLTFGVDDRSPHAHSIEGLLVTPVVDGWKIAVRGLMRQFGRKPSTVSVPAVAERVQPLS